MFVFSYIAMFLPRVSQYPYFSITIPGLEAGVFPQGRAGCACVVEPPPRERRSTRTSSTERTNSWNRGKSPAELAADFLSYEPSQRNDNLFVLDY